MPVNKVIINNQTVIDLTGDTVTATRLAAGTTAHKSDGTVITGSASIVYDAETQTLEIPSFFGEVV